MKIRSVLILILSLGIVNPSSGQQNHTSGINPPFEKIEFPAEGFAWMEEDLFPDSCMAADDTMWVIQPADSVTLMVATDGPHGSGRYWTVTIGIAGPGNNLPDRGICLQTTTIGWRTLQRFNDTPLPWLGDRNNNDQPEVIIWGSFPLHEDASMAEFGLMAWVYEIKSRGVLQINWPLSHQFAGEIAEAYRQPLNGSDERLQKRRNEIARHLEKFASKKCNIYEGTSH